MEKFEIVKAKDDFTKRFAHYGRIEKSRAHA